MNKQLLAARRNTVFLSSSLSSWLHGNRKLLRKDESWKEEPLLQIVKHQKS